MSSSDDTEELRQKIVEALDCLIYLLGSEIDEYDNAELAVSFEIFPKMKLATIFADCLSACLGDDTNPCNKELQIVDDAVGALSAKHVMRWDDADCQMTSRPATRIDHYFANNTRAIITYRTLMAHCLNRHVL